jgi:ribonuclease P protein component
MPQAELRPVDRLRQRRDFLAAAKADKAGVASFLLQGRNRRGEDTVRLGLTVTKKIGNAVVRNRIRRRLRAAAGEILPAHGRAGYDYVLVARPHALHAPFSDLTRDLERAIARLHGALSKKPKDTSAPANGGRPA